MRADVYMVQYGYAATRSRAARMIAEGSVNLDGKTLKKSGEQVDETVPHRLILTDPMPYVGRGGVKLERALDVFSVSCSGRLALDVGASTGGFTDCLLRRGAAHVFAVDAGSGQLAPILRQDRRVTNIENCNARYLSRNRLGDEFPQEGASLAVMDVSFISQTLILPVLADLLAPRSDLITLIKPQFEAGRANIAKGGIVRSATARREAVFRVLTCAEQCQWQVRGVIPSPIEGGDGNVEYLAHLVKMSDSNSIPGDRSYGIFESLEALVSTLG